MIFVLLSASQIQEIDPDSIRYEVTPEGKISHLLKYWSLND